MPQEDRLIHGRGNVRQVVDIAVRQRQSDLGRAIYGFRHRDCGILTRLSDPAMRNELLRLTLCVPNAMKYWRHGTILAADKSLLRRSIPRMDKE